MFRQTTNSNISLFLFPALISLTETTENDDDELKNWSHIIKTEMKCMFCSQWGETRLKCFELSSTKTVTPDEHLITDTVIDPYPAADECVCRRQVSQESIVNKMSPSNLACVFGVNLVWPRHGSISLSALMPINVFTEILIEHFHTVFGSRGPAAQVTPWRTCSSSGLHRSAASRQVEQDVFCWCREDPTCFWLFLTGQY